MAEDINEDQQKTIVVNKVQVMNFSVSVNPKQQVGIGINFNTGYEDAEGNFVAVEAKQLGIVGEDFAQIVTSFPDSSKTIYDNIKELLYIKIAEAMAE